jgi:subtilisin family serine protease
MRRLLTLLCILSFSTLTFALEPPREVPRERTRGWTAGEAMILHPSRPLTDEDRAELAAKGILVRHALTDGRFLARVTPGADIRESALARLEPLTADVKVHPSARAEVGRGKTWAELNLIFHRDVPFEDARNAVLAAGGALPDVFAVDFLPMQRLTVKIAPQGLNALANDERVLTIAGPERFRMESHNAASAALSNVPPLYEAPYGLSGEGVTVSVFELGSAQASHPEFGGRLILETPGSANSRGEAGIADHRRHATHVAGTIAAAGVNGGARGIAPKATVVQFCTRSDQCGGGWLSLKNNELASRGVVADNNSWGYILGWSSEEGIFVWNDSAEYYGAYTVFWGTPIDDISIKRNVLFVHSAGNSASLQPSSTWAEHRHVDDFGDPIKDQLFCYSQNGTGTDCPVFCNGQPVGCEVTRHHPSMPYDTMGVTASGKNVLAVGAIDSGHNVAGFSSRGPAKDGRVKPDVVARGVSVFSPTPTNAYQSSSGTSMAAPAVTGIAALLTEQWRRTFAGLDPTAAQLRTLIIAGTDDLGSPGPDYTFGFGLVNAKTSVDTIIADGGRGDRIRNLTVSQGQQFEIPVIVSEAQPLRVVLGWPDPPVAFLGRDEIAAKALVNDLDLHVIDPTGAVHLPYVLDKNNPTADAARGVNTVDNTEMVEIPDAGAGTYRVVVRGTNVTEGPQKAVLVTSARAAAECRDLQEPNDTPETAHGNLVPRQMVQGAICSQGDIDYFKFVATATGPVRVTLTAADTPIRATLTGPGINASVDVPAGSTRTLSGNASAIPAQMLLRLEAIAVPGADPRYSFVPEFGQTTGPRRRSAG